MLSDCTIECFRTVSPLDAPREHIQTPRAGQESRRENNSVGATRKKDEKQGRRRRRRKDRRRRVESRVRGGTIAKLSHAVARDRRRKKGRTRLGETGEKASFSPSERAFKPRHQGTFPSALPPSLSFRERTKRIKPFTVDTR